MRGSAVVRH
jgi:hypothetical protein